MAQAPIDNIYVGELPVAIVREEVEAVFNKYGSVVSCRVLPARTGGQTASALVRFSCAEEAQQVIETVTAEEFMIGFDDPVVVRFANKKVGTPEPQLHSSTPTISPIRPVGAAARSGCPDGNDNVFIANLPADITSEEVQEIFAVYGEVVQCRALPPKGSRQDSAALVRFSSAEEASAVVDALSDGHVPEGLEEPVKARPAEKSGEKGNGKGAASALPQMYAPPAAAASLVPTRSLTGGLKGGKGGPKGGPAPLSISSGIPIPGKGAGQRRPSPYPQYAEAGQGFVGGGKGPGAAQWATATAASKGWRAEPAAAPPPGTSSARSLVTGLRQEGRLGPTVAPASCQVFVRGLPSDTTDLDLTHMFSPFGGFVSGGAKVTNHPGGGCKGFGFVNFFAEESAQASIEALDGFVLPNNSTLSVSIKAGGRTDYRAF